MSLHSDSYLWGCAWRLALPFGKTWFIQGMHYLARQRTILARMRTDWSRVNRNASSKAACACGTMLEFASQNITHEIPENFRFFYPGFDMVLDRPVGSEEDPGRRGPWPEILQRPRRHDLQ